MSEPLDGFEYLDMIQKQKKGQDATSSDLSRYLEKKARAAGVPINGQFELTPLCNFSCKMCYIHLMKDQMGDTGLLTVDQWKDLMHQAWQAGMIKCSLTGGECLTYPGFDELYLYLRSLGCEVAILTNGFLLDQKRIRFFQEHKPAAVQITLYGCNDDVYERVTGQRAFKTVRENIRNLIKAGIRVVLSITPSSYLGEDALETLKIAYSLTGSANISPMLLNPREETGRSGDSDEADLDLYIRLYRLYAELNGQEPGEVYDGILPEAGSSCSECVAHGIRCGAGRSLFTMNWKGIMTFCSSLDRVKCYPLEDGFMTAWKKLNKAAENWLVAPECEGCAYKSVCINCAAYENQFAEPGKKPVVLCERTKYFVRNGIWNAPVCE